LILDHDLLPFFGQMAVRDVSPTDVQEWIRVLASRPLSPSTIRRVFTILDQLFDSAVDLGLIAASPTERVRLPRVTRTEMRFLIPVEHEHLAVAIDERYRAMVLPMAWATLRIGEATGLRRSDIDVVAGTIHIANNVVEVAGRLHEGPPKTAAGRRAMHLPLSLVAELAKHLDRFAGATYGFCDANGEILHAEEWRTNFWRPAVKRAGLAPLRPHDLKHTGVAFLAAAGVDPSEERGTRPWRSLMIGMVNFFPKSTSRRHRNLKRCGRRRGLSDYPYWRRSHQ
jgi:integrase